MNIKELSESLGVSESDVSSFIKMIISEMRKDNVDGVFLTLSEIEMGEMAQAYGSFVTKKFSEFYTTYITNTNVNSLFNDMVFARIKYGEEAKEILKCK